MATMTDPIGVIVLAAPADERSEALQWEPLPRRPILAHTLTAIMPSERSAAITLIVAPQRRERARRLAARISRSITVIAGDSDWRDDVCAALATLPAQLDWIVLLDGTRPLITVDLIAIGLAAAQATGAATAMTPAKETIKQTDEEMRVVATLDRAHVAGVHAPRVVRRDLLVAACANEAAHDVIAALIAVGVRVMTFPSGEAGLVVRTADDLAVAATLLARRRPIKSYPSGNS